MCCVGTDRPGTVGATGRTGRTGDPGFSGSETSSGAIERFRSTGLHGSRKGMSSTRYVALLCLTFTDRMPAGHMPVFELVLIRGRF